tara:strand:+ start:45 stop:326 length:282 start_codon:yes stop_codon:yes gene_type:complete
MANEGLTKYTVQEATNLKLGQLGFDYISYGDGAQTGNWIAVYNPNANYTTIDVTSSIGDSLSDVNLCSNGIVYGQFTSVKVERDDYQVIAYRG